LSSKKLKILHVIRQGQIGGGETHVYNLVRCLDKNVFQSIVLAFTKGELVESIRELGVECMVIPTIRPFNVFVWRKVYNLIIEKRVDIVHAHGTRACSNSYWSARRASKPMFYTVHGWSFHPGLSKLKYVFRLLTEKFLIRKTDYVINVSKSDKELGIRKKIFGIRGSTVIPNGVDTNFFRIENPDITGDLRKELEIPDDSLIFGLIARMTKQKDPLILLKALKILITNGQDCYLIYVGGGELLDNIKEQAVDLGILNNIRFVYFVKDVRPYLNLIDVYCLPSLWEGLSIGLLEAMAMRRSCVVSDIPPNTELIKEGINGRVVPIKKADRIADAINFYIKNGKLLKKHGQYSEEIIRSKFSLERMVNAVSILYLKANGNKKGNS